MTHGMTRREFTALGGAGFLALASARSALGADSKTLRFIVRTDLRVLDPIWTTAYVSRNHGYMIFDTLLALDSKFKPQPQMVGDYSLSSDQLVWRFALRPGLKFHDGQPVRGADCVASLRRWMARDSLGQTLKAIENELVAVDDHAVAGVGDIVAVVPYPVYADDVGLVFDGAGLEEGFPGVGAAFGPVGDIDEDIVFGPHPLSLCREGGLPCPHRKAKVITNLKVYFPSFN